MIIVYTDAHQQHQPPQEIYDGEYAPYAEVAARADSIIARLRSDNLGEVIEPGSYPLDHTLKVHQKEYVEFIKNRAEKLPANGVLYPSYFMTDTYAPITHGTFTAATKAVDAALTGADKVLAGEPTVYALCRPPGHHAEHNKLGGYCYFNNAAIAADYMTQNGKKVAILDIDFHHGNGTQQAFYERADVLYVSIHADPNHMYPYSTGFTHETGAHEGQGYNKNYPLPLGTDDTAYQATLATALDDIKTFAPDYLIVSCGFDTYKDDPIGGFKLTVPGYAQMGSQIQTLGLPTLVVQEGGYCVEALGDMAASFLSAFN
ncbi:MAG: histone deacetylase family protein [Candidatus Saccharimonadales bacterium]